MEGEYKETRTSLKHGDIVIAAITSCTNTSNPSVMLGAGLLANVVGERTHGPPLRQDIARPRLARGHRLSDEDRPPGVSGSTWLPGSRLRLHDLHRQLRSAEPNLEETVTKNDLVVASVLSGNRNFEARVHQSVKANFLMSPPLVVAFALAEKVDIDLTTEPLGKDQAGNDVYLKEDDARPAPEEIGAVLQSANDPETYRRLYKDFEAHQVLE